MVFTDTGRISEDTRRKVLEAGDLLGYRRRPRNAHVKATADHVGILISTDREWTFIWHFLTDMIIQIEQELSKSDLQAVMIPISHHEADEQIYRKIRQAGCRAVMSVHIGRETLFERLETEGTPVIVILNNQYQDRYFSICTDDFQGAYEGTRHLIQLGHRRIDFVDAIREDLPILSSDRYYGFRKALEEQGLPLPEGHRVPCQVDTPEEELERCFRDIMSADDTPTALFCLDDEIAFRTWNALTRLGYRVPEDISLLAPGDVLDYTKPYIPPITTMHIDMTYMGRLAAEMLDNRLNNEIDTVHVLKVKQQLVERGSCRPPA